jgi:hypothetical protein
MVVSVALFIVIIIVLVTELIKYLQDNVIFESFKEPDLYKYNIKNQKYIMPYWI